ncbi:ionotropic glutamate receptor, metazoa, Periplasmic binding protein-like I [Artemisia annua]|uniref:Glutamate receptor n=1 Tax=Artemisia annua TaxID=35608 RepID=A0A2U1KGB8_ARTAN|nr:ionotropic glutamate receptor, metazoa, Periplasmic binding protein-like I [Artemisia annua]
MHNFASYLIFLVAFVFPLFLLQASLTTGSITSIGVILDQTSRPGKEAKVAIEIAIQDFNNKTNQPSVLYIHNSKNKPVRAAIAAKELIEEQHVKAIVGGHTWEEASAIAEGISEADYDHDNPVFLSLASTTPLQPTEKWPFFVQFAATQSTQMNAVAAILQSWGIRQVTLIYETSHVGTSSSSIISYLSQALRKTNCVLAHILPLMSGSYSLNEELELLKKQQRQVFVIHTSLELGIRLFQIAKKMEMTGDGYLWIATNRITDHFHSINPTTISSLKGMVGLKSYFPEDKPDFINFRKRFHHKFHSDYPEEDQDEPGIFALQGYNSVKFLENNALDWKRIPETIVEIVYVIGKGYHSAYWTEESGFSETVEDDINEKSIYMRSLDDIGIQALWPVQPWYAHRRHRNLAESSEVRMRVGVPAQSLFKQFVSVEFDSEKNQTVYSGFVIAVFDEMMRNLNLPYDYIPFNGSYDELVRQIPEEKFDAIAGDVTIMASKHDYAEFTQPYTESGLEMIVPIRSRVSNQPWLFLKPFTAKMWWLIAAITIYNGFIIWFIEKSHCKHLRGSFITQVGVVFWLAFTTLFTLRGDKLHSNLSRIAVVVWLFVALIITQSYTASLSSMLTAQRLEPTITSVEMLRNINATVGYCNGSLVNQYLKNVLGFNTIKVNSYNSTRRYAEALNSGEIAAIFLEVPAAKVFLAQYCKSFVRTGETFKVGGFGFAFPRNFAYMSEANKAIMNITESGKLKKFEDEYLISEKCIDNESFPNEDERLSPQSFSVLFGLTGGTSTIAFILYIIISFIQFKNCNPELTSFFQLISAFVNDQMRQASNVVAHAESPIHHPDVPLDPWNRV